ncbi:TonB family protein [Mucilaginibacter yixingensis]|uniref:TonB family protein n=2 Tax=Mucilaginibacter yixingensis TaxID=1295612 RepID=A0A2T5JFL7_9SPHI|nr:TonB family protein [Mucilaginibacter yixingensis]
MGKAQAIKPAAKVNPKNSFTSVVVMHTRAQFPGGSFAMRQFLSDAGRNSVVAHSQHYSGSVNVYFDVDPQGQPTNFKVLQPGLTAAMSNEAIRILKTMPKFTPASYAGKNKVSHWNTFIKF